MKKNKILPRPIEGNWDARKTEVDPLGIQWITLIERPPGEHIWCFRDDGIMISREYGRERYAVYYWFEPDRLMLSLDGWLLNEGGERELLIREEYRVEFPGPAEMYLYDREDVETGEAESLRLTFERI